MLPGSEKSEDAHKAAQMPRRTLASPVQVTRRTLSRTRYVLLTI